jgi:hypothetical protein
MGWRILILALSLSHPLPAPARAPHHAGQDAEQQRLEARVLLARVAESMREVRELRADYQQEQESILLEEPLLSSGRLHLRAEPGCVVLEILQPRPAVIRSDAKSHQVYHPRTKRAERFLFESNDLAKALLACFSADLARIEELFAVQGFAVDTERGRARIDLLPKSDEVKAALRSLRLELDLATLAPAGIVQTNAEGERLTMRLGSLVKNPERAPGEVPIFDRPLPADVQVIERRIPPAKQGPR